MIMPFLNFLFIKKGAVIETKLSLSNNSVANTFRYITMMSGNGNPSRVIYSRGSQNNHKKEETLEDG